MTCESGSSPSGASTMIDAASCGLTISRSSRSIGLPVRQTTWSPGRAHLGADLVLHLDLVLVGEDDDARLLLVRVGDAPARRRW